MRQILIVAATVAAFLTSGAAQAAGPKPLRLQPAPTITTPAPSPNPPVGGVKAPPITNPSGVNGMQNNMGTSGTLGNTNGAPAR
jgi:hypothetical protein